MRAWNNLLAKFCRKELMTVRGISTVRFEVQFMDTECITSDITETNQSNFFILSSDYYQVNLDQMSKV